jgi:hypothetical protein
MSRRRLPGTENFHEARGPLIVGGMAPANHRMKLTGESPVALASPFWTTSPGNCTPATYA